MPGQYFDLESGWNHNGFRNYMPTLGRYLEPDPLALQGTARFYDPAVGQVVSEDSLELQAAANILAYLRNDVSFYAYANGNPITFIDPFGLCWIYHQSTGVMEHVDSNGHVDTTFSGGYSGHGPGVNNPDQQSVSGIGPLPRGAYTIVPIRDNRTGTGHVLRDSMRLSPDPNNQNVRAGGLPDSW